MQRPRYAKGDCFVTLKDAADEIVEPEVVAHNEPVVEAVWNAAYSILSVLHPLVENIISIFKVPRG